MKIVIRTSLILLAALLVVGAALALVHAVGLNASATPERPSAMQYSSAADGARPARPPSGKEHRDGFAIVEVGMNLAKISVIILAVVLLDTLRRRFVHARRAAPRAG